MTDKTYSTEEVNQLLINAEVTNWGNVRQAMAAAISGGYDFADTLHNIYIDFGYPAKLDFFNYWNMYRRFGIAGSVVEKIPDTGWMTFPTIEGSNKFNKELELVIKNLHFWQRIKGLDVRQRIGRYAGMFMRVKDGKKPDEPITEKLNGIASLVQMIPLYESQLKIVETENDPTKDNYGKPTMYQFSGSEPGNRDTDNKKTFKIHPDRVVLASEGADDGGVYGISSLEGSYNSLMDLRKIIGAGGEGFYKNAAKDIVFNLTDGATAKGNKDLLAQFNENYDDFARNRSRRSLWTPGMEAKTLESNLTNPKEFFFNALYDVAASTGIPATVLIGQQTGRLASSEDSKHFLSMVQSRRENFMTEMTKDVIDWKIKHGVLPESDYELEWDDLLASSDSERLENADKMASINEKQFKSGGGLPFGGVEIREAAGFEADTEIDDPGEELDDEEDE